VNTATRYFTGNHFSHLDNIITLGGMNAPPKVLRTKTPGFAHHSLAFSPFFEDRIAVASGANFGLVGNGRVHILSLTPGGLGVVKW
jgi:hypothetical protein